MGNRQIEWELRTGTLESNLCSFTRVGKPTEYAEKLRNREIGNISMGLRVAGREIPKDLTKSLKRFLRVGKE